MADLQSAYQSFWRKNAKFPKFKAKHASRGSFRVPQGFTVDIEGSKIKLPKLGWIRFRCGDDFTNIIKHNSVTVSIDKTGKFYASLQCVRWIEPKPSTGEVIGIDLGIKSFYVDSNGETAGMSKFYRKQEKKLKHLARFHSKAKNGSRKKKQARYKLAKKHKKIANQRRDFLHKLSTKLIDENQVIIVEDLAVKNMMRNHCLAKSIQDAGWLTFLSMLRYKAEWHDRQVLKIDRFFPSSKTCHSCGHIVEKLPLNIREWDCPSCGVHLDRDHNAALNILRQGLNLLSDSGTESDSKQKLVESSSL